jgi:type IV secretory pathway VirB4 component
MKHALLIALVSVGTAMLGVQAAFAQEKIYRCPNNEYINNSQAAQERGCKLIDSGNITIIPSPGKPDAAASTQPRASNGTQAAAQRSTAATEQRAREADRRAILEAELRKLEARQSELQKEYNNGEPDKQGIEARNHQRYLDRVAEMKASLARTESDIASVRGELNRLPAPSR